MAARPYPPQRAYRVSVLPLGLLCAFGGVFFIACVLTFDERAIFLWPFESNVGKRLVGVSIGVLHVVWGVGLILRSRAIWRALLVYLVLGPVWQVPALHYGAPGVSWPVASLLAVGNLGIAVGIYFVTRPAFTPHQRQVDDD